MALDWDKLRLFHVVAEAGSFTEGARRLRLSQPALSRQIIALEEQLDAKLFHRHARGLALTHEGEQLYRTTREIQDSIARARAGIDQTRNRPTGEVRLTTTVSFGSSWLPRQLADFLELYPDIRLHLILSDTEVDLARREADCAIRFQKPTQADLIQRPLAVIRHRLCASPEYLARYGEPRTVHDLLSHRIIAYGPSAPPYLRSLNWALELGHDGPPREPALSVNSSAGVLAAVEAGAGIAALPSYLIASSTKVKVVLPDVPGAQFQTYFVYPSELKGSVRLSVLRDFLVERMTPANLGDSPDLDRREAPTVQAMR
ncbi:MAG: LysR substrate-binding domain-containing protein [Sphingomonadaceae bacterium]|uniref:LysR family transcriptional regulator n=1 Tax=Thermaurantiacus sp. TaxID=2820283 RepID=UPI00298F15C9|nr:LysR substrate-binding domain-containing protein [Thermaurantiacus sp.]MCS6987623.1 LysR substrate-binding domain-containing protein [Sphingomonadaceae bacterium]MDW8415224.1 LysR substrate-binding domain-containing protein [Thermaurantiacus sp.]